MLSSWAQPRYLQVAGLFHSIYGTEGFQGHATPYSMRGEVSERIGGEAEKYAYWFCVVDRLTVDLSLPSLLNNGPRSLKARPELGGFPIEMTDSEFRDFIVLTLADWLEQVESAATKANPLFLWEKGQAWTYRRSAFAQMAEILRPGLPEAGSLYDEVMGREPEEWRGWEQKKPPPMSEEGRRALVEAGWGEEAWLVKHAPRS